MLKINGFIFKPEFAKKTRGEQYFFVNNRFIKSPYLNHAINSAFEGLIDSKYNPSYFLNLSVSPSTIDINIHPTKTEIKFEDDHSIYAILRSAVRHSIGQYNISPVLDFKRDKSLDVPYNFNINKADSSVGIDVDLNYNPFEESNSKKKFTKMDSFDNLHLFIKRMHFSKIFIWSIFKRAHKFFIIIQFFCQINIAIHNI